MRTFTCSCGNRLFFGGTKCLQCGLSVGMCPDCLRLVPLIQSPDGTLCCGQSDCGIALRKCSNAEAEPMCNRCLRADDAAPDGRCDYCRLTTVIPDLRIEGNRQKWRRLEQAKQRALFILDLLGLPFRPTNDGVLPVLSFEFKADEEKPVPTGHLNGCITINIREADDVERERSRVLFDEPHRTLIGHFRHELGHYFWDRLVNGQREEEFRNTFGDERNPTYAEALEAYHANGPRADWQQHYISAYATMHAWEDFAETFGAYLDMVTVLDTACHFGVASCDLNDVDAMIKDYQQVGMMVNEFNRDMGLFDLVPEVFVPGVIDKVRFIHSLARPQAMAP